MSFHTIAGIVPDFWLDIADEAGLIIQNEFFIWPYHHYWDTLEIKKQVINWMEDEIERGSVPDHVFYGYINASSKASIHVCMRMAKAPTLPLQDKPTGTVSWSMSKVSGG